MPSWIINKIISNKCFRNNVLWQVLQIKFAVLICDRKIKILRSQSGTLESGNKLDVKNFDFKIMFKIANCDLEEQTKTDFQVSFWNFKLLKGVGLEYEKSTNWKVELVPVNTIISYSTIIITPLFGMSIKNKYGIFLGKKCWLNTSQSPIAPRFL